ncbi:hypothetical protein LINPERHAP1_LOCUS183 [Linum perenne]
MALGGWHDLGKSANPEKLIEGKGVDEVKKLLSEKSGVKKEGIEKKKTLPEGEGKKMKRKSRFHHSKPSNHVP